MRTTALHSPKVPATAVASQVASPAAAAKNAVTAALRVIARTATLMQRRLEVRHLAQFDERMLKDIGLAPGDVQSALDTPWTQDPTRALTAMAVQHRIIVRAHAHQGHEAKTRTDRTLPPL